MGFLKEGKKVEEKFAKLYCEAVELGVTPIYSTKEQDIKEHWDVRFNGKDFDGYKYDVKGVKKVSRSDSFSNELYHFIEIKNVNGDLGWAYGEADIFAFEVNKYFILVDKNILQDFIADNVKKIYVDSPDKSLYCLYTRDGRRDVITLVTSIDLCKMARHILPKNELEHFTIGESVYPEIRAKERMAKIKLK